MWHLCLVLLQVPKYFVPVQILWASPKIWLHLVPLQKLLCRHNKQFYWMQIIFLSGTKCLWLALNAVKFLGWLKKFGLTQNILGPVKGQGISMYLQQKKWEMFVFLIFVSKRIKPGNFVDTVYYLQVTMYMIFQTMPR